MRHKGWLKAIAGESRDKGLAIPGHDFPIPHCDAKTRSVPVQDDELQSNVLLRQKNKKIERHKPNWCLLAQQEMKTEGNKV